VGGLATNAVCGSIGDNERSMINRLAARLNTRISESASAAGVVSVGTRVYDRFAGHNACDLSDEQINALDFDIGGGMWFVGPNSFHPKLGGQLLYAYAFTDALVAAYGS
jgi:hypothetical protein